VACMGQWPAVTTPHGWSLEELLMHQKCLRKSRNPRPQDYPRNVWRGWPVECVGCVIE